MQTPSFLDEQINNQKFLRKSVPLRSKRLGLFSDFLALRASNALRHRLLAELPARGVLWNIVVHDAECFRT